MARSKRGRSKPVSEKDAGEKAKASDDVAELLDNAATPEGTPEPAEAVASGPQPMPGSASDTEEPAKTKKATQKPGKDLRKLAPKKPKKSRKHPGIMPGASALQTVLARGIDPGDTSTIAPVEVHRVTKGGKAMISGRLATIKEGARLTRLTHDLNNLRLQGIELTLVDRG